MIPRLVLRLGLLMPLPFLSAEVSCRDKAERAYRLRSASALAPPGPGREAYPPATGSSHPWTSFIRTACLNTKLAPKLITGLAISFVQPKKRKRADLMGGGNQYWKAKVSLRSPLNSPFSDSLKNRR